jgi:two-component system, NtrC family, response regulator AtoC
MPVGSGRPLVMIVDDDVHVREAVAEVLQNEYEVVTVGGGIDALLMLRQRPVSVIVLDVVMPEMDGLATLKRARELNPSLGIVMVTAVDNARVARDAMKLGALDYLTKPFTCQELRAAVKSALPSGSGPLAPAAL